MSILAATDTVILAGGLGKRLQSVTKGEQKVLAKIDGKPFIAILIDFIASQGGKRFILCTGHGAENVEKEIGQLFPSLEILFSKEDEPLGTGGAIKKGSGLVKTKQFLAMNGDCFCPIDYNAMVESHIANRAQATIAVTEVPDAREYGTIEADSKGRITAFKEKQPIERAALINTGTYCLDRHVFDLVPTAGKFSIEYDFFPHLINKTFCSFRAPNRFIDIGTPERYEWARSYLKDMSEGRGTRDEGR